LLFKMLKTSWKSWSVFQKIIYEVKKKVCKTFLDDRQTCPWFKNKAKLKWCLNIWIHKSDNESSQNCLLHSNRLRIIKVIEHFRWVISIRDNPYFALFSNMRNVIEPFWQTSSTHLLNHNTVQPTNQPMFSQTFWIFCDWFRWRW
jgi:hypothetical protein